MPGNDYWNAYIRESGHTSYRDAFKLRYDRPHRMKAVNNQIRRIRDSLPQAQYALEFGCGEGDVIALLREQGWTVTGVDVSDGVLSVARTRFANDSEVRLFQSESGSLPADLAEVDLCTVIDVFQNVLEDESVVGLLSLIRSRMTERGRLLTLEIATSEKLANPDARMRERTPNQWREIYSRAGFRIESESIYAIWGITLIQQFDRLLARILSGRTGQVDGNQHNESASIKMGVPRRIARFGIRFIRRSILIGTWPIDYILKVPVPGRWAFHRIFVLKIQNPVPGGNDFDPQSAGRAVQQIDQDD
jgi:ubiquinone/menaquinone biosynthesis C-methylase UbiE